MANWGDAGQPAVLRARRLDACPVCRHGTTAFAFASIDLLHAIPGMFTYDRCPSCRSYFQNPRIVEDDLTRCYPHGYFTHETITTSLEDRSGAVAMSTRRMVLRSMRAERDTAISGRSVAARLGGGLLRAVPFVRRRAMFGLIDELGPPTRSDRCLELGPGTGDDMWRLTQLGWRVTGIDLDGRAAELAAARSGCPVAVGAVLDHQPSEPYGLIFASHSIEHVPELAATVAHLRSILADDGRLVLVIPNPESLTARRFGPLAVVWDPPRHLALPSVRAWGDLLRSTGFRHVRLRTTARRAGRYHAIARARQLGVTGIEAWSVGGTWHGQAVQAVESVLVRCRRAVGEEIVISATAA